MDNLVHRSARATGQSCHFRPDTAFDLWLQAWPGAPDHYQVMCCESSHRHAAISVLARSYLAVIPNVQKLGTKDL